jgi:hypothetical protein
MMNKGYICVVQNTKTTNYLKLAYALALSIKNTQSDVNRLSIVTDIKRMPKKYRAVFDQVIPIKTDRAKDSEWKLHNIVDLYDYTPYDETVMLDCDMLFLTDVSHWWEYLSMKDVWFTTQIKNMYNDVVPKDTIYRKEFIQNELPSVYNAFFYFKKSEAAADLFNMMKHVCNNWDYCVSQFLYKKPPRVFSTDVAFGLSLKLLNMKDSGTFDQMPFPYFIHMKAQNQGWKQININEENWLKGVDVSIDNFNNSLGIKICTLRQFGVFHYHIKSFVTDKIIEILES